MVIGRPPAIDEKNNPLDPYRLVRDVTDGKKGTAHYCETPEEILSFCSKKLKYGDIVVFMSSGSFDDLPARLIQSLRKNVS